jgi:general secretion pathway protein H
VQSHARGFTLIEIMLVMVLLSFSAMAVVMTLPDSSSDQTKDYANQLYQRLLLLSEESMLIGREYGFNVTSSNNEYQFVQLKSDGWQWLEHKRIPEKTELSDVVAVELTLGNTVWFDNDTLFEQGSLFDEEMFAEYEEIKQLPPPNLILSSSGDLTPATIAFYESNLSSDSAHSWRVVLRENGTIGLLAPGEEDEF